MAMQEGLYTVKIRREGFPPLRKGAEQLDGCTFYFTPGFHLDDPIDQECYAGEFAMIPRDPSYPDDAPTWLASGDLISAAA